MAQRAGIQIGELSRRTGCNIVTIRYYEQIALLPAPARSAGRYRVYGTTDVRRLAFIRRVREVAERHLADVRAKIADLQAMEGVLADAVRRCASGEVPGCPIIDALSAA